MVAPKYGPAAAEASKNKAQTASGKRPIAGHTRDSLANPYHSTAAQALTRDPEKWESEKITRKTKT